MTAVVERFVAFLLLFPGSAVLASDYAVIRNPASGMVLEPATDGTVRIQSYTGSDLQLWLLQCAKTGDVDITNKATRKLLDIGNASTLTKSPVIISNKTDSLCQRWVINSDRTIANACRDYVLDIVSYKYEPGQQVEIFPRHATENQLFELEFAVFET